VFRNEANMTKESFVEDAVYNITVINASFGQPPDGRARSRIKGTHPAIIPGHGTGRASLVVGRAVHTRENRHMWNLSVPWWEFVLRGTVVYGFLLVLLRVTGKRQVGQLAPFDLVLLLVLSNAVQNSMNAGDNSLVGGLISATTLVGANFVVGLATEQAAGSPD
jgi:hypothetical protein